MLGSAGLLMLTDGGVLIPQFTAKGRGGGDVGSRSNNWQWCQEQEGEAA